MERMPGVMFIIDTRREHIAVKEARKLGVPTIALIDTDSDPDLIDLPIPGNDDAMRAIEIILKELADSIIEGKTGRARSQGRRARSSPAAEAPARPSAPTRPQPRPRPRRKPRNTPPAENVHAVPIGLKKLLPRMTIR